MTGLSINWKKGGRGFLSIPFKGMSTCRIQYMALARMRRIDPSELLPEEVVLQKDPENPFLGPGDRPEPYRTQYIAYARLQPILQQEKLQASPLVVQTPRGWGLVWRWWPRSMGVVLMRQVGNDWEVEDNITFLTLAEQEQVRLDLTRMVLNPPKWH